MTPPTRASRKKAKKKAPSLSSHDAWGTAHEVEFLQGLGTGAFLGVQYKNNIVPMRAPRITLLQRYLHTMQFRARWGDIDSAAVRQEGLSMLRKEKERALYAGI